MLEDKDLISTQEARRLVEKAHQALQKYRNFSQEQVDRIVAAMARAAQKEARNLAELAVQETGYGNAGDKTIKNLFCAVDVFRYMRDLRTCGIISENREKKVVDIGVPAGVIVAITPTTNPTSTAIFKILSSVKGRNSIVLSPHPNARHCTTETARVMYEAGLSEDLPEGVVGWMETVTLEGTRELMHHPLTSLILATGGAGLVRAAYSSGKPAYGVGPGNVPAFIEQTADVPKAVRDVIKGKTFDNGLLCSSEQSLIYDRSLEKQVLRELERNEAVLLEGEDLEHLKKLVQKPDGRLNTEIVGQSACTIAHMASLKVVSQAACLVGRESGVGPEYPLSREKLSPILALYSVDGWEEGCERCIQILEYGGLGHTMAIHSADRNIILKFGLEKPAYRICVNTPATLGSVGLTTGVPPSMTLGCGTPGGNITSDNITPLHLINVKRVAFETRDVDSISYETSQARGTFEALENRQAPPESPDRRESIRGLVQSVVSDYLSRRIVADRIRAATPSDRPPVEPQPAIEGIPETGQKPEIEELQPVTTTLPVTDFVSERDVRIALENRQKIVVNRKTIITPAARDCAEGHDVFEIAD